MIKDCKCSATPVGLQHTEVQYCTRFTIPQPFHFDSRNELNATEKKRKLKEYFLQEREVSTQI